MSKKGNTSNLTYRIGTYRSGVPIMIPDDLSTNSVSTYIQSFSLDDRIDILCVTEFLMQKNEHSNVFTPEAKITALLNGELRTFIDEPIFSSALNKLGLTDSTAFIRFGRRLCWPVITV